MKILAFDSSAVSASAAVIEDGKILAEEFVNVGLTHSRTLLPLAQSCLETSGLTMNDIDALAISNGPGSFTGVRIGIAAVKGLAAPCDLPCCGISTLEAMAYNMVGVDCTVCCVMDARCNQVYTAMFSISGSEVTRLSEDSAISVDELSNLLKKLKFPVYFVGDGAELCYNNLNKLFPQTLLAPELLRYQRASSVAAAAQKSGKFISPDLLLPVYLRLPQAERELKKKNGVLK